MLPMNGPYPLEQLIQFLKGNQPSPLKKWELLRKASEEILVSIALLPADISLAWNRLIQASHEERCSKYLMVKNQDRANINAKKYP